MNTLVDIYGLRHDMNNWITEDLFKKFENKLDEMNL